MHINPSRVFQTDAMVNSSGKQPPAMAARALLQNSADWANQPFGKLVSLFARGEDIPAATDAGSASSTGSGPDAMDAIGLSS